ncbi:choice-of-anchor R domain-containing protein [Desulforamulus hydrothermalis]|uniref:choice-of-anchor R domain-containing protein n=1 Tax=Desulforamulus hydrothermalis TaxID=412895 RepID=UPI000662BEAD|nr:choice-of-anchor R domain-containing protein [Desulforamulus hydrothermalis]SHH37633.1 hypothetical protein SAMN02745177_02348 [Desulforamulus hydrothermalis Lam5 = DSM 18033]
MPINAFKNGVTPLNEATMNALLNLQPFSVLYEGTQRDAKTGSGVLENTLADYNYCCRFTATGTTEVARVELHLDKDGTGSDLVVQIRSGMNPAAGTDGTLLKEIVIPAEFIPTTAAYISIPINLSGLTSGAQYWIVVKKGGDATNHLDWVGETTTDTNYPAYRRAGNSGAWTATNALHFRVFSGASGLPRHVIEGVNAITTIEYSSGLPSKLYQYIPPSDGPAGGVRDVLTISYSSGLLTKGV